MINLVKAIEKTAEENSGDPFLVALSERAKAVQESFEDRQTSTEEALAAFNKAEDSHFEVAGITCGGQLAELFQKYKTPWVKIPQNNIPPRASLGYQLTAMVKILMAYGLLNSSAQSALASLPEKIIPADFENQAKMLCVKLGHKIPVIYSSQDNRVLARLCKIILNENAKIPAFYNFFPELNHNEMVGWTKNLGYFHLLLLRDKNDLPRIRKRMELTAELLKKHRQRLRNILLGTALQKEHRLRIVVPYAKTIKDDKRCRRWFKDREYNAPECLQAAAAVGAQPILVLTGKGEKTRAEGNLPESTQIYPDLAAVARALCH